MYNRKEYYRKTYNKMVQLRELAKQLGITNYYDYPRSQLYQMVASRMGISVDDLKKQLGVKPWHYHGGVPILNKD